MNKTRTVVVTGLIVLAMAATFLATSMTVAWEQPTAMQKVGIVFCWFIAVEHVLLVSAAFWLHHNEDTINKFRQAYVENIGLRTKLSFAQQERCGLARSYNQLAKRLSRHEPDVEQLSAGACAGGYVAAK